MSVNGEGSRPISGFPRKINVSPGKIDPIWTTARGSGLHTAFTGKEATFIIQPKDTYDNDKYCRQSSESFIMYEVPMLSVRS